MADLGMHMQLWIDLRALPEVADSLADIHVPLMIDHMGHQAVGAGIDTPGFQALLRLLGDGRCWVKLSGAYRRLHRLSPLPRRSCLS